MKSNKYLVKIAALTRNQISDLSGDSTISLIHDPDMDQIKKKAWTGAAIGGGVGFFTPIPLSTPIGAYIGYKLGRRAEARRQLLKQEGYKVKE